MTVDETKSEVSSIRISSELKSKLHEEAVKNGMTTNALMSKILSEHVNWSKSASELGVVIALRPSYKAIMDSIDKDKLICIARTAAKNELKKLINYIHGELNFAFLLEEVETYLIKMRLNYKRLPHYDYDEFIIYHDLGKNWPHYFVNVVDSVLVEMGHKVTDDKYEYDHISFKIVKR